MRSCKPGCSSGHATTATCGQPPTPIPQQQQQITYPKRALNPMYTHPRDTIIIDYPLCPVHAQVSPISTQKASFTTTISYNQRCLSFDKRLIEFRVCIHLLFSFFPVSVVSLSPFQPRFCPLSHQMFLPGWPPCFTFQKPLTFRSHPMGLSSSVLHY